MCLNSSFFCVQWPPAALALSVVSAVPRWHSLQLHAREGGRDVPSARWPCSFCLPARVTGRLNFVSDSTIGFKFVLYCSHVTLILPCFIPLILPCFIPFILPCLVPFCSLLSDLSVDHHPLLLTRHGTRQCRPCRFYHSDFFCFAVCY